MRLPCRGWLLLTVFLPLSGALADFDAASSALQRRDFPLAIRLLVEAADGGDSRAAATLADLHERGLGTPRDAEQAIRWRRLAAEQGNADSALRLGHAFARGDGVARSDEEAKRWYRMAAERGHPQAQLELSKLLGGARATEAESRESVEWYGRAVAGGADVVPAQPPVERFDPAAAAAARAPTQTDLRMQRAQREAARQRSWLGFGYGHGFGPIPRTGWYDPFWQPYGAFMWGPAFPGVYSGWGWNSAPLRGGSGFSFGFSQGYRW